MVGRTFKGVPILNHTASEWALTTNGALLLLSLGQLLEARNKHFRRFPNLPIAANQFGDFRMTVGV
jgi:hypothetical protein